MANSPSTLLDAQAFSPEPMLEEETSEAAEEAGSYSPQMLHGDENEEAIDPEEDKAILVTCLDVFICCFFLYVIVSRVEEFACSMVYINRN